LPIHELLYQAYIHDAYLSLLIHGLATWRVSHALVYETGPWGILTRLRERTGIVYNSDGSKLAEPDNSVLGCVWCTSVWVALALIVVPVLAVVVLAASAVAIVIEEKLI
jgi:hypothetical protein